jgi:hypothetical protein
MMKRTHAPQFGRSRERPTVEQKQRMDWLSKMPCVCCEIASVKQIGKTYVHHIVDKGYREHSGGHDATLPLCLYHHQGDISVLVPVALRSMRAMREKFGPSLALEKRTATSACCSLSLTQESRS